MGTDGMGERRNKELAERGGRRDEDRPNRDRPNGDGGMGQTERERLGCPQVLIIC